MTTQDPAPPTPFATTRPTPRDRYAASLVLQVWNEARKHSGLPPVDEKTAAYGIAVECVGPRRASSMHNVAAAEERRATVYHESHVLRAINPDDPEDEVECVQCGCTTDHPAAQEWCTAMPTGEQLDKALAPVGGCGESDDNGMLALVEDLVRAQVETRLDSFLRRRQDPASDRKALLAADGETLLGTFGLVLEAVLESDHVELTDGQRDAFTGARASLDDVLDADVQRDQDAADDDLKGMRNLLIVHDGAATSSPKTVRGSCSSSQTARSSTRVEMTTAR